MPVESRTVTNREGVRIVAGLGEAVAGHEAEVRACASPVDSLPVRETLRDTRHHRTVALRDAGRGARILKWQRRRPPGDFWRDVLGGRGSSAPAAIEFANLRALRAGGFSVPDALGWGRTPGGGTFVLLRPVGGIPLDDWLRSPLASDRSARREVFAALAALLARFHGEGWHHRDLYACHVLVDGDRRPALIDFSRARRARRLRSRWREKDLAALQFSTERLPPGRAERLRFLLAYLGKDRVDGEVRRVLRRVLRRAGRMRRHVPREG